MKRLFLLLFFLFPVVAFAQGNTEPEYNIPATVATILSVFLPVVIQRLKQSLRSETARFLLALGLSGATGALSAYMQGVTFGNIVLFISVSFTLSQAAYRMFWKKLLE